MFHLNHARCYFFLLRVSAKSGFLQSCKYSVSVDEDLALCAPENSTHVHGPEENDEEGVWLEGQNCRVSEYQIARQEVERGEDTQLFARAPRRFTGGLGRVIHARCRGGRSVCGQVRPPLGGHGLGP